LLEVEREAETQRLSKEEARQRFDLAHGPLLRARLVKRAEQDHLWMLYSLGPKEIPNTLLLSAHIELRPQVTVNQRASRFRWLIGRMQHL